MNASVSACIYRYLNTHVATYVNEKKEFEVHKSGWMYEDDDTFYAADTMEEML